MTTMAASARTRTRGRILPKGWPDFLLQLFLFALVDLAYESSRMLATGDVATAFVHARDVVSVEQTLGFFNRSEEHTSELQSHVNLVCRLLLEKKKYTERR